MTVSDRFSRGLFQKSNKKEFFLNFEFKKASKFNRKSSLKSNPVGEKSGEAAVSRFPIREATLRRFKPKTAFSFSFYFLFFLPFGDGGAGAIQEGERDKKAVRLSFPSPSSPCKLL